MDSYNYMAMTAGVAEAMNLLITFCLIWFAVYGLIGAFVKVHIIRRFSPAAQRHSIRYWPVFLSHALFSIIFVNLQSFMLFDDLAELIYPWLGLFLYMVLLPVVFDILLLRVLPQIKGFRWLLWVPPWKPLLSVSFTVLLLSCIISYAATILTARLL